MPNLSHIYAQKALSQLPRLLGNQDRNPFSPTYGCLHRDYWLDKTSDFPDAVRQFAVHALALVYKCDFPDNIYKDQSKIGEWAIAGMKFWIRIQHKDGSFDEFYPYERGWVGPSAFTCFTITEAYNLLEGELSNHDKDEILTAIQRTAQFIAEGESEKDHLANHHAMAALAVWKAYRLTNDPKLKKGFDDVWSVFLDYHNHQEGWSREYDGVDPGYLSATVSFLGKVYQDNRDPDILAVLKQAVEFVSYFVYPNGFYAGSMGSRNTLHFYPHGFEILAPEIPLAAAIAERTLQGLADGALVPPEIVSDRYVVYRVPEFLQSYLDYSPRPDPLPDLPYQKEPFSQYFPESRIFVRKLDNVSQHVAQTQTTTIENEEAHPCYIIANLAKGGVLKVFDVAQKKLLFNDCGLVGQLTDGRVISSQWIDPAYTVQAETDSWEVQGNFQAIPSNKLFTPLKNIVFRSALVALGWSPAVSHFLKGQIRKTLILGQRAVPVRFRRQMALTEEGITLTDEIRLTEDVQFARLAVGDEFFVRYVPQSCYFQSQELDVQGYEFDTAMLASLNINKNFTLTQTIPLTKNKSHSLQTKTKQVDLPEGVYDIDYYYGRQTKKQLIYRLRRRTDEVERALNQYNQGSLQTIVDIGTADGLMLADLRQRLGSLHFIGLDYSPNLLQAANLETISKTQADAQRLPLHQGKADAIIATAIIKHLPNSSVLMQECARILRIGGLLVLTTPDPRMDKIASAVGLLKDSGHQETFDLKKLRDLCEQHQFEVVESSKFMFSPIGFPAEKTIEKVFGSLGLSLIMANQLIVARKLDS